MKKGSQTGTGSMDPMLRRGDGVVNDWPLPEDEENDIADLANGRSDIVELVAAANAAKVPHPLDAYTLPAPAGVRPDEDVVGQHFVGNRA